MPRTAVGTLDRRILDTLALLVFDSERDEQVVPAYTATALSLKLGVPVAFVLRNLTKLVRTGLVITRRPRSGDVLYKLPDANHWAWNAMRGVSR
jgi:hypothetical protein